MDHESESFEARAKRLFGSNLFETVPKSSFPTSSWSVAGGEVERREWRREGGGGEEEEREDHPCSSAFYDKDGCLFKNKKSRRDKRREFEGDLSDDDDDEEEEEEERGREKGGDEDEEEREERQIRSSVGLDPTLDNEDEEDEYDKAAVCKENGDERVYMRDVKNHSPYLSYNAIVPDFLDEHSEEPHHFRKDPRADHSAAITRLKEDSGELPAVNDELPAVKIFENDESPKPILKRKEAAAQMDSKPKKRVRFDSEYLNDGFEEPQDFPMVPQSMETGEVLKVKTSTTFEESPGVPDYLRNPSKYTRYSFDDSSENSDEETNRRAFEDFRNLVNQSKSVSMEPEFPVEPLKSVAYTPRKKLIDIVPMDDSSPDQKQNGQVLGGSVGISVGGEADEGDACEMDEDETVELPSVSDVNMNPKRGRQYRSKSTYFVSDDS